MMAAEKWYEYQKCYKKYGIDLKPSESVTKEKKKTAASRIGIKDRIRFLLLILMMGALCVGLIITAAYSSQIKMETNSIMARINTVQGEIENLNVTLKSAGNIATIEEKAINELGMVYPCFDQIAYINTDSNQDPEFAATLKQLAFKK